MVKATIIGARGYLGRELIQLLLQHPNVDSVVPTSRSNTGEPISKHVPRLGHVPDLSFHDPDGQEALDGDVVFLATPAGEAPSYASRHAETGAVVIDLSRDHRLQAINQHAPWTYGLADIAPVAKGSTHVANPGCYPTATLLAIAPALKAGLVAAGPLIVDGKSGVSGAGVNPQPHLHYPEMNESVTAYKVLGHDHTHEIKAASASLSGVTRHVRFTPHLVPQTRGLLATVYAQANDEISAKTLQDTYQDAYANNPFVRCGSEANTGHVSGTNHATVAVDYDPDTNLIIARGAIDNLLKGGSGTAIQNMNDAMGWNPALGLAMGAA